jgi:hypothetical protein
MPGHDELIGRLQERIRWAYGQFFRRGEWVKLSELRPYVGGYRELVDEALRRLARQRGVSIVPESNQKTLTAADRAAAVRIGNQDKHLIAIN